MRARAPRRAAYDSAMKSTLFDIERHEPCADVTWDEQHARTAIARIVADTHRGFDADSLWKIHPFDVSPERPPSLTTLYYGAAGVIWALAHLAETGAIERDVDYARVVRDLPRRHRVDLERHEAFRAYLGDELPSYFLGEAGMLMLSWKLEPSAEVAARIHASLESRPGDGRGLLWGAAGSMIAALHMYERTGEARWAGTFRRHFDALWARLRWDDDARCFAWTETLYGETETRIGALHGFCANAYPVLRGGHLLAAREREDALERIAQTLAATALVADGCANWPHNVEASALAGPARPLVQFCSGAPGVMMCLAMLPQNDQIEALLTAAGELVWRAGPTTKLPVLCHGAAGSGYALLKLYARTDDEKWLARARAFAMHAIDRADEACDRYGQRKYSLWTGDLGLAVFLWDCVRGRSDFPTLDVF